MLNKRIDHFEANPSGGRDLIVGDIHGEFTKLEAKLTDIGFNPSAGDRLFAVGDLIDRGPESDKAIQWLAHPWFKTIRGNHEEALIAYVAQGPGAMRDYIRGYGAGWVRNHMLDDLERLASKFQDLPLAIELETAHGLVVLLHGDCPTTSWAKLKAALSHVDENRRGSMIVGASRADALALACTWSRDRAERLQHNRPSHGRVEDVRAVLLGHTPMQGVKADENVMFIDTVQWLLYPDKDEWVYAEGELTVLDAATLKPAERPSALDWRDT